MDATHNTNRWLLFVIPLVTVGPDGHNMLVGLIVLRNEDVASYVAAFRVIEGWFPGWLRSVVTVMTDGLRCALIYYTVVSNY